MGKKKDIVGTYEDTNLAAIAICMHKAKHTVTMTIDLAAAYYSTCKLLSLASP